MNAVPRAVAATSAKASRRRAIELPPEFVTASNGMTMCRERRLYEGLPRDWTGFFAVTRLQIRVHEQVLLVALSADNYAARPLISSGLGRRRVVVIVKPARLHRDEVVRLMTLPRSQHTNRIDLRAVGMFRMRIGRDVVSARILIHEQHARPGRYGELLRRDAGRRQGERIRVCWWRRVCWRGVPPATRGEQQQQNQNEDCHSS